MPLRFVVIAAALCVEGAAALCGSCCSVVSSVVHLALDGVNGKGR